MKVAVIGNYGATNVGDEAILTSLLKMLSDHEVTVFSSHPDRLKNQTGLTFVPLFPFGFRSFFRYGFRNSIRALKAVDAVVLGGGGLFQDNYLYACFLWAWQVFWVKRCKKPLYICAAGVGPLHTWWGKKLTRWAYEQADKITVRDEYSHHVLRLIGIKKEIEITADPVFSFQIQENEENRTKNLFIISLRPWLNFNHQILETLVEFLKDLKEEQGAEFIFVCMQKIRESDLHLLKPLLRHVGGELYVPQDFSDLLKLMQRANFAIGMRYHFMIAAILTSTPLIPISYGPKTESLFDHQEFKKNLIKFDDLTPYRLKNVFDPMNADQERVQRQLEALAEGMKKRAEGNEAHLRSFLAQ